jgi:membrane protein YqaA with SNARE-associated domain
MVRLEPILTDPEEDRQHNKIGAAMLGAFIGAVFAVMIGLSLAKSPWLIWVGCPIAGAILGAPIGYLLGERLIRFVADNLRNNRRFDPFDLDD